MVEKKFQEIKSDILIAKYHSQRIPLLNQAFEIVEKIHGLSLKHAAVSCEILEFLRKINRERRNLVRMWFQNWPLTGIEENRARIWDFVVLQTIRCQLFGTPTTLAGIQPQIIRDVKDDLQRIATELTFVFILFFSCFVIFFVFPFQMQRVCFLRNKFCFHRNKVCFLRNKLGVSLETNFVSQETKFVSQETKFVSTGNKACFNGNKASQQKQMKKQTKKNQKSYGRN